MLSFAALNEETARLTNAAPSFHDGFKIHRHLWLVPKWPALNFGLCKDDPGVLTIS